MEPDRLNQRFRQKRSTSSGEQHSRSKRAIPHIIYPEILVIVDYDGYRLHGGDNIQVTNKEIEKYRNMNRSSALTTTYIIFRLNGILYHFGMV